VPSGSVRIASDSSAKLTIIVATVMTVGPRRVKPLDCFMK
jgi:hypothetical protein